jgi:hypothetical protein
MGTEGQELGERRKRAQKRERLLSPILDPRFGAARGGEVQDEG